MQSDVGKSDGGRAAKPSAQEEGAQDYPLMEVPEGARRSDRSITLILFGFTLFVGSFAAGGQLGPGFSFWQVLGVIFLGSLLLGLYVAILGLAAQKSGLNTVLLARFSFGNVGSKVVDLLLGFTQIGWYAWQISLPAVILSQYLGEGWRVPLLVLLAAAFTWTAYIGISALVVLSRVAVPAILILVLLSLALTVRDAGGLGGLSGLEPTSEVGIALAITIVFGSFASGGTQTTNWTRFASTPRGAFVAGLSAFVIGNGLMLFAGALGALVYGQPDIVQVLDEQGLLVAGLLLMLLSIWVVTDRTVYAFSVAGANLLRIENRRALAIVGSIVGLVLAISGFYNFLVDYLILLGTFIPPIGAVIAADYFVKRRGRLPAIGSARLPAFNWVGIASYVAASLVAYFSPGIPPLNGILAGFAIYLLLDKVLGAPEVATATSEAGKEG